MPLSKTYQPKENEPQLETFWQESGVYHYDPKAKSPVYSIDTQPPTVSGYLHLGHVFSYSHADFMARFFRMNGFNVFYPMGFDDNGLPTDRLVEKRFGITAAQVGRQAFIEKCLEVSESAEKDYRALWQRLGLSVDWRYTYRTIDDLSRRTAQLSFIDLFRRGLAYRQQAPTIWCPECHTAIAQADLNDLERQSEFVTLAFKLPGDSVLPIATTRPELLAACVAIFVHPNDARYKNLPGRQARVPYYGQVVPILADLAADPSKGTGIVMCCTFGDQTDVAWWRSHNLSLVQAIDQHGKMTDVTGLLAGLTVPAARRKIKETLQEQGTILANQPVVQSIRVHERCDTPVEYLIAPQWFIRILDHKAVLLEAGNKVNWHPEHMRARYQAWVENLNWDWCISRQRYFGVPFPVWYCQDCGQIILADEDQLPVDPLADNPCQACECGSHLISPETDVMDTWATSSLSPQIVGQWLSDPELYHQTFPMSLRPQGHEIIRTWAFYTIAKSWLHFGQVPWKDALISGWALAGEGMGKISKSRGGGPMPPQEMIERYSADAVRYWAASTSPGKDAIISEEKIQAGSRLVTKLWNVARFCEPFLADSHSVGLSPIFTPADRWILSSLQSLIHSTTADFQAYEYTNAKNGIENFFFHELADNYLEMAKQRLYDAASPYHVGACYTLGLILQSVLKLLAPVMPYITETIYQTLFAAEEGIPSIHRAAWPGVDARFVDEQFAQDGETLVQIASAVRRYKSEHNLSLGHEINLIQLAAGDSRLADV
ncbi:MAG: valine--tRNA ligase, partial [Planctomycetes bacterium]|nr:valine--tRNA ligase [Planctomycetota bacterium]